MCIFRYTPYIMLNSCLYKPWFGVCAWYRYVSISMTKTMGIPALIIDTDEIIFYWNKLLMITGTCDYPFWDSRWSVWVKWLLMTPSHIIYATTNLTLFISDKCYARVKLRCKMCVRYLSCHLFVTCKCRWIRAVVILYCFILCRFWIQWRTVRSLLIFRIYQWWQRFIVWYMDQSASRLPRHSKKYVRGANFVLFCCRQFTHILHWTWGYHLTWSGCCRWRSYIVHV